MVLELNLKLEVENFLDEEMLQLVWSIMASWTLLGVVAWWAIVVSSTMMNNVGYRIVGGAAQGVGTCEANYLLNTLEKLTKLEEVLSTVCRRGDEASFDFEMKGNDSRIHSEI